MSDLLDRNYQLELLLDLAEHYPHVRDHPDIDRRLLVNISYLHEHSLVETGLLPTNDGKISVGPSKITAQGLDFLQADGGLSAILGTITIKLHDDTLRSLLIAKINSADAKESVKASLAATIRNLPAETLKKLAQKAMDAGIESLPAAIEPLREWLNL